ncbi:MAG: hypothetical protein MRY74_05105 [Neomegalonema sp.]|nr:hypothetical protein [Neomegalonema sp.]
MIGQEIAAAQHAAALVLDSFGSKGGEDAAEQPWRVLAEARCPSCAARYRVAEAPLGNVISGWFRCSVCASTVASWDGPVARAYTLV